MCQQFRAIVIDDLDFCRELLSDFLADRGYQVRSFPDVTSCPLFPPRRNRCPNPTACADILLLDNRMPYMTGIDFLELQQHGNCHFSATSKAIFSADWSAADLEKAKQFGCKTFHKPYDLTTLVDWLNKQEKLIQPDRTLLEIDKIMGGKST